MASAVQAVLLMLLAAHVLYQSYIIVMALTLTVNLYPTIMTCR